MEASQLSSDHLIPELEGLDAQAGLIRMGGNSALYLKLLRKFLEIESTPRQIAESLADGQRATAERLAHTISGNAAGLGIVAVASSAARLEKALRADDDAGALVEQLESVLCDFLARLRLALPPESLAPVSAPADPAEIGRLMVEIDARLAEFDVEASELFEEHRGVFAGLLSADELSTLGNQIANFAFPEARATLRKAAEERAIPLP